MKPPYVYLDSSPRDERCEQAGITSYDPLRALAECEAWAGQLRRLLDAYAGEDTSGVADIHVFTQSHDVDVDDLTIYYEVGGWVDDRGFGPYSWPLLDLLDWLAAHLPAAWDAEAEAYLAQEGYPR
jgi:hypothetical protein